MKKVSYRWRSGLRFLRGGVVSFLALGMISCHSYERQLFLKSLEEVRSVARVGRQMQTVKKELENHGYEVSRIYDPTKLGERLCMDVFYGGSIGVMDGLLYAADLPTHGPPSSIQIEGDERGVIRYVW